MEEITSKTLPNELIIEIFNYTETKLQMITIFPWLKNFIPECDLCGNPLQIL